MKKQTADEDPLDREIDFSKARRNPYFLAYYSPRTVRVLEADLAEIFPDDKAVNAALRSIADAAQQTVKRVSARRVAAPKSRRKKAGS